MKLAERQRKEEEAKGAELKVGTWGGGSGARARGGVGEGCGAHMVAGPMHECQILGAPVAVHACTHAAPSGAVWRRGQPG